MTSLSERRIIRRIYSFILDANLLVLIVGPTLVGLAIFGMFLVIWPDGFTGTRAQALWDSLGWFCISLSGIPKIIRRETFIGIIYVKGTPAIIDGIINLVLPLALASIPIIWWNR